MLRGYCRQTDRRGSSRPERRCVPDRTGSCGTVVGEGVSSEGGLGAHRRRLGKQRLPLKALVAGRSVSCILPLPGAAMDADGGALTVPSCGRWGVGEWPGGRGGACRSHCHLPSSTGQPGRSCGAAASHAGSSGGGCSWGRLADFAPPSKVEVGRCRW